MTTALQLIQVGGTLRPNRVYIPRSEDEELLRLLAEGEYVNVIAPRQMGKSSLIVRAQRRLRESGFACAMVDLQGLGSPPDAETYFGLLAIRLGRELGLADDDIKAWWARQENASPSQKLQDFFTERVLPLKGERIVIFLDEIDSTLKFPFTDDLFLALRYLYNERSRQPELERLVVCLIGVAAPNELVKDRRTTPYNVGRTLFLRDFDPRRDDLSSFLAALGGAGTVLDRILHWTGGQPFLVAKMVDELGRAGAREPDDADRYVAENFSSLDAARGQVHFEQVLRFVETRFSQGLESLALYRRVLDGETVMAHTTPAQLELELAGLVKRSTGHLVLRNPIYATLFDRLWLERLLPKETSKVVGVYRGVALVATVLAAILLIPAGFYGYTLWQERQFVAMAQALAVEGFEVTKRPDGLLKILVAKPRSIPDILEAGVDPASVGELDLCTTNNIINVTNNIFLARIYDLFAMSCRFGKMSASDMSSYMRFIGSMTNLESLDLSGSEIESIDALRNLTRLKYLQLGYNNITDISALRALVGLQMLELQNNRISNIDVLRDLAGLQILNLRSNQIVDIEALRNLPLTNLDLTGTTGITSLEPLKGMPLTRLNLSGAAGITSLEPLKGMPLTRLNLSDAAGITSLEPLKGMPLTRLNLSDATRITSLEPLKGMPLTNLDLTGTTGITSLEPLKGMPLTWLVVSGAAGITSLEPLKGMPLERLDLSGAAGITSLEPLKGMPLTRLNLSDATRITSLEPLKGMPLTNLDLSGATRITSLEPLKGMPLTNLDLTGATGITSLEPLKGMPLTNLDLSGAAGITSLEPLKGMPLTNLDLTGTTGITSLEPLRGMPLTQLDLTDATGITSLEPLRGMPLTRLNLTGAAGITSLEPLSMDADLIKGASPELLATWK